MEVFKLPEVLVDFKFILFLTLFLKSLSSLEGFFGRLPLNLLYTNIH